MVQRTFDAPIELPSPPESGDVITLVKAAFVIGFADGDHRHPAERRGRLRGDRIVFVGRAFPGRPDRVIDAGNAILGPGFIDLDALADIDHAILDTWHGAGSRRGAGLVRGLLPATGATTSSPPDDRDFRHEFAFTQLIRNGITTAMPIGGEMHNAWCETYEEWEAAAAIAARLGLRMYLGPSYRSGVNVTRGDGSRDVLWNEPLGEAGLADAVRFVERPSTAPTTD